MRLYLVRHGDARPKSEDPDRRLSARGAADVKKVAAFLKRMDLRVADVRHSGKTRAAETADILAQAVGAARGARVQPGMRPDDPVEPMAMDVTGERDDRMLVGHLPFMARLASRLLAGRDDRMSVAFPAGAVACLGYDPDDGWSLEWMVTPDML